MLGSTLSIEGNATPLSTAGGKGTAGFRFRPRPLPPAYAGGSSPARELRDDEELLEELRMYMRGLEELRRGKAKRFVSIRFTSAVAHYDIPPSCRPTAFRSRWTMLGSNVSSQTLGTCLARSTFGRGWSLDSWAPSPFDRLALLRMMFLLIFEGAPRRAGGGSGR